MKRFQMPTPQNDALWGVFVPLEPEIAEKKWLQPLKKEICAIRSQGAPLETRQFGMQLQ
jgi:hypothetical protein